MRALLNYRHLYYFWVVAREGGVSLAADRLGMAVQTVSSQVRTLERALGAVLLKPKGRGLALTEAGRVAARTAEQIFELGAQLPVAVRDTERKPISRLAVGISDALPKLAVRHLLKSVLGVPNLRLRCVEGQFEYLLGNLALHRIDVVLTDRAAPPNPNLSLRCHPLACSAIAWYAPASLYAAATRDFPHSLAAVPVLLPTRHAAVRERIDRWLDRKSVRPSVRGEFEDGALLRTFGAGGLGVFPAAEVIHDDLLARYQVQRVGTCDDLADEYFAIGADRRIMHPLVSNLLSAKICLDGTQD
jgi:LysR family transcriptional activator of nhaA